MNLRSRTALVVALASSAACASTRETQLFAVTATRASDTASLVITPAAGVRLSAALPPAFESSQGVVRFTGRVDPADSLYFAAGVTAPCPARGVLRGVVRASLCASGEGVCRTVTAHASVRCG